MKHHLCLLPRVGLEETDRERFDLVLLVIVPLPGTNSFLHVVRPAIHDTPSCSFSPV